MNQLCGSILICACVSTISSGQPVYLKDTGTMDIRVKSAYEYIKPVLSDPCYAGFSLLIEKSTLLNDLSDDGFILKSEKQSDKRNIKILYKTDSGLAYGLFRLRRIMLHTPEMLDSLDLTFWPKYSRRIMYEEAYWDKENEWDHYVEKLHHYLEEGINIVDLYDIGWSIAAPEYVKDNSLQEKRLKNIQRLIKYAHTLGMKVYLVEGVNYNPLTRAITDKNLSSEISIAEIKTLVAAGHEHDSGWAENFLLCMDKSQSVEILKRSREYVYSALPELDGVVMYLGDPGGCACPVCSNWGQKNMELINDVFVPTLSKANPRLDITITTWGLAYDHRDYYLEHTSDLNTTVKYFQMPPTAMFHGRYLTYDQGQVNAMRQMSHQRNVIHQQFFDGVGFKKGHINLWEHPMPREMHKNLSATKDFVKGLYGSAFDMYWQYLDLRILMEWAWQPERDPCDTLAEFGDEHFGPGVGKHLSPAVFAMEDYWNNYYHQFFYESRELGNIEKAYTLGKSISDQLQSGLPFVKWHRDYYTVLQEQAAVMMLTAHQYCLRKQARENFEKGDSQNAINLIEQALADANQVCRIILTSKKTGMLKNHEWGTMYDLLKRPQLINHELLLYQGRVSWKKLSMPDDSFEQKKWKPFGANGYFSWSKDSHSGKTAAFLKSLTGDGWQTVESPVLDLQADSKIRISFWYKSAYVDQDIYLDFQASGIDGANSTASLKTINHWDRCQVEVSTPAEDKLENLRLRFVLLGKTSGILIDDITLEMIEKK